MKRESIRIKKAILNRVPEKDYNEMITSIADNIYNRLDYDVVILLARKFSKLYSALLPLVREECDGLIEETHDKLSDEQDNKKPIVITDRALDWVVWKIRQDAKQKKEGIRKILLADDIIIHGRSLMRARKRLKREFKALHIDNYKIDIAAYAVNTKGLLIKRKYIDNWDTIRKCTKSDWKLLSGEIVDTIYLTGQTYTSYVPNARFKMDSEAGERIQNFIKENGLSPIVNETLKNSGIKSYAYIVKSEENFKICESYRIYEFPLQREYIFVPMVSLRPVDEICLNKYIELLLKLGCLECCQSEDSLRDFLDSCSGEYKYRLALYVASAFFGRLFLQNHIKLKNISDYEKKEEQLSFYFVQLKDYQQLCKDNFNFTEYVTKMEEIYCEMISRGEKPEEALLRNADVLTLEKTFGDIITESKERGMVKNAVGKLLTANSRIDEKRYEESSRKKEDDIQDRTIGIPLVNIVSQMIEKGGQTLTDIYLDIFREIDYGRGSIVAHCFDTEEGKKWYTSLMHAGEENYRYYIDNYLPVLYGLCMLEFRNNNIIIGADKNILEEYWDKFYEYAGNLSYLPSDKKYLIKPKILQELRDAVEEAALYWTIEDSLNIAIKTANEFMVIKNEQK